MDQNIDILNKLEQVARLGQQGQFRQAEALCREVLAHAPENARAWHLLGLAQLQSQAYPQARASLEQAMEREPKGETAAYLGVCHCQTGDLTAGIAWFERGLALEPDSLLILNNLLLALQKSGDAQAVLATAERLLRLRPSDQAIRLKLARLLVQLGRSQEAVVHFRSLLAAEPAQPRVWIELGMALRSLGESQSAIAAYRQALVYEPDSVEALTNLGVILQENSLFDEAETAFKDALAKAPDSTVVLFNLGTLQAAAKQTQAARISYEKLLQLDPNHLSAIDGLVRVMLESCDWEGLDPLIARLMTAAESEGDAATAISPYSSLFLP
ncbi:MAG: tetratricopeptide repeat protein, partial [Candidatus Sericytochromatia bacterium]